MTDPVALARAALAAFASGDTIGAERFIGPDYVNLESGDRSSAKGPAEFRETVQWMHRAFADIRYEEIAMLSDDGQAIAWVRMHATHAGPFLGIPAERRRVAVEQPEGVIRGVTCGLTDAGYLRVRQDDGNDTVILAGGVRAAGA